MKFLQGQALFFDHPIHGRTGRRIAFHPRAFDGLATSAINVHFDHGPLIAQGRLKIEPHCVWYECEIADDVASELRQLMAAGKLRGSSFNIVGTGSEKLDAGGTYDYVERVASLIEVGPVAVPCDYWTTCRISDSSIMPASSTVAGKRPLMTVNRPVPKAMLNAARAFSALRNGEGCVLNGRHISNSNLQKLFAGGSMAIM